MFNPSEDRVSPIDVEVLVENLHRGAVAPADGPRRLSSANLVLLEGSQFPEDFQTAEKNADLALRVPPMHRIPRLIRPIPKLVAACIRRLLNPFACIQRLFNRAVLKLLEQLRKDQAALELEVARQRQVIRKLEKMLADLQNSADRPVVSNAR
jgi:hypothetical protein